MPRFAALAVGFASFAPLLFAGGAPEKGDGVRRIVLHLKRVAEANARDRSTAKRGDALANHFVREAARFCRREQIPTKDFLISLGIAFDPADTLRKHRLTRATYEAYAGIEPFAAGEPTMRKRGDWFLHFALSASLAAAASPETAEIVGLAKELRDALGPSGFSFADLAADDAGVAFARILLARPDRLGGVADSFAGDDYLPPLDGLEEGLSLKALTDKFGDPAGDAFRAARQAVRTRIEELPVYKKTRKDS